VKLDLFSEICEVVVRADQRSLLNLRPKGLEAPELIITQAILRYRSGAEIDEDARPPGAESLDLFDRPGPGCYGGCSEPCPKYRDSEVTLIDDLRVQARLGCCRRIGSGVNLPSNDARFEPRATAT
jgi:hypothetical protein